MQLDVSIDQIFTGHADAVYTIAEQGDGKHLFSGSGDGFVASWDLSTGAFKEPVARMPAPVYSILPLPDRPVLAAGLRNGVFYALDIPGRKVIRSLQLSESGLFDMCYDAAEDRIFAGGSDGSLYVVDALRFDLLGSYKLSEEALRTVRISPCGKFLIAGASDNHLYFLSVPGEPELLQTVAAHENSVFTAVYKDGYSLLTGGRDAMLKQWTWDKADERWTEDVAVPAHNFTVNKIALQPGGQFFATASRDKTAKIWDRESLKLLKVLDREKFADSHTHSVNTLLWLNNEHLLTAGDDRRIIRWSVKPEY